MALETSALAFWLRAPVTWARIVGATRSGNAVGVSRRFLGGQTPAKADKRIRSKWSRWMRYAADHKLTSG
jgi:hypothetical protein